MELISYAQNFEDIRLWRAFRDVERGRYLDIGTQDPTDDSVSRLFYDRGWRGVHVEPTATYAAAMRDARPDETVIEAAVSNSPLPIKLFEISGTGLSTGVPEIARFHREAGWTYREILVPTITLASLLEFMGEDPIHWLKIDVEGMEADVLASWGDHPARPAALVIEATKPSTQEQTHAEWHSMVASRGYSEVLFDGLSRYFIHETEVHRCEALALSPNVFDGFQVLRTHFSTKHVAAENVQAVAELQNELETKAQAYSEQVAQAAAAAVDASSQLDAALQRVGELEGRLASDAEAHSHALAEAQAAVADAYAQLEVIRAQAGGLEHQLQEQARLHAIALTLAEERTSGTERALEVSNEQLAAIQAEHLALGRLAGRLEGQLETQKLWDAASRAEATAQQDDLSGRLSAREQELVALHELVVGLRTQLAVQIAQGEAAAVASDAQKAEMSALLGTFRAEARQLTDQVADLTASLALASQQRDEAFTRAQDLSDERVGLLEKLEAARQQATEHAQALRNEIAQLREHIAWRERQLQQAAGLLAAIPDPLAGLSQLLAALVRLILGEARVSAIADLRTAASHWGSDVMLPPSAETSQEEILSLAGNVRVAGAASVHGGIVMVEIDGPITSVPRLLAPHDKQFIHTAYQSVLGRAPDAEGEAYYLARLRAGVHKLAILKQLRRSPEGRTFVPSVAGLDRAIKRHRWATMPFVGSLVRLLTGAEGNSATHRHLRILANELGRLRSEQTALASAVDQLADRSAYEAAEAVPSLKPAQQHPQPGAPVSSPPPEPVPTAEPSPPSLDPGPMPQELDSQERRLLGSLRLFAFANGAAA